MMKRKKKKKRKIIKKFSNFRNLEYKNSFSNFLVNDTHTLRNKTTATTMVSTVKMPTQLDCNRLVKESNENREYKKHLKKVKINNIND